MDIFSGLDGIEELFDRKDKQDFNESTSKAAYERPDREAAIFRMSRMMSYLRNPEKYARVGE